MSLWRQARYYCTNTAAPCRYAIEDIPFSVHEFGKFAGRCRGNQAEGCGAPLALGDPKDLRLRWALLGTLVVGASAGIGFMLRTFVFLPPLEHVAFVTSETRTDDGVGALQLDVVRDKDLEREIQVEYMSVDGSAKAGEDYEPVRDRVSFSPGERRQTIRVMVLPDRTLQKETRYFALALVNVAGVPREIIQISPRAIDRTQEMQAGQMVLSTSRIAADIGGFVVKRDVLLKLLTARAGTEEEARVYQRQLVEVEDNLSRARDGYSQSLRELQDFTAPLVMHAIDHLYEDLESKHFTQQSRALQIMKSQFAEFVEKKSMDMDRWVQELATTVPRVESKRPESST